VALVGCRFAASVIVSRLCPLGSGERSGLQARGFQRRTHVWPVADG
jgi:hypothetical protein